MANTYVLINSSTVGSGGVSSITFSSIPPTYTDLKIVCSTRDTNATANNGNNRLKYNGSSTTDYSTKYLYGNGATTASGGTSAVDGMEMGVTSMDAAGNTASVFSSLEMYIPNYGVTQAKSVSGDATEEQNGTTAYAAMTAGLRTTTDAITSVTLTPTTLYAQYSTFYLYGIKNS